MNPISLAHYTVFLICMGLICFILIKNPKSLLNRVCALLFGSFALFEFTLTFYYDAITEKQAILWNNISSIGWISLPFFYLWFSLIFTNRLKIFTKWYLYCLPGLVPALFIYLLWTGQLVSSYQKPSHLWWQMVWANSIWPWLFFGYYFVCIGGSAYLDYQLYKKTPLRHVKKQAGVIALLGSVNLILDFINYVVCSQLKIPNTPFYNSITTLIWVGGITYAISKYQFMVLTPAYAASDIIGAMSDSLILIDPEGKLVEANPATLKLLGYTRAEITGQPVEILFFETPLILKQFDLERFFQDGAFKKKQISFRTKNGEGIPVSLSSAIMRDRDENLIGVVVIGRDLRELLRLQERERDFIVEKARAEALQERAQELQEAYDQLKAIQTQLIQSEKMAAVGKLAGGVAHEVNNPIGIILGFAQSIACRIKDDGPLYLPLKSIEREAIRCKNLVGNLLTFSRIGKTQTELIDINQTVDETLSLIEAQTKVKNIEITRDYETDLPQIMVNKNQLQQVIINLCNNAIDAIDNPDVTPESGNITIAVKKAGSQIVIEISDTGKGMTEDLKKHIFEPFFTTKEVGKGTGLGLSLCYEIIQKHNGIIEVESEAGEGATFRIKLPIN